LFQLPQPGVESSAAMASARAAAKQFVQCTKCGRTNAAEARFCDWCGTKVSERCVSIRYGVICEYLTCAEKLIGSPA